MLIAQDLHFSYSKKGPEVLKGVDLTLQAGEIGILMGRNGAGKTTLFKTILGIEKPSSGSVYFNGEDFLSLPASERAKRIGYVPQHIHFGALSVFDSVLMGRISYFGLRAGKEDYRITENILEEMGLSAFAHRNAEALSGGERQKVAIARAMAQEPGLLLFDEPTGNLDIANESLIIREAKKLAKEKGIAILSSLHDINRAMTFGDRFYFMKEGSVIKTGGRETFTAETVRETFGIDVTFVNVNGRTVMLENV